MDELILQSLTGNATASQREQLRLWRERSPDNEARYQELCRLWTAAALAESGGSVRGAPAAAQVIRRARRNGGGSPGAKAFAAVASWRAPAAAAAGIALLIAGVVASQRGVPDQPLVLGVDEVVTGAGEHATIHLRDGTVIRLGGASRLRVTGTLQGREVELNGRAFFAVEPQPGRPFRIRTTAGDVHVLGTRFDLDAVGDDLQLIVVQGRVAMDVRGREVELPEGTVGRVLRGTLVPPVHVPDAHRLVDWKSRFLAFQETPLSAAAAEISAVYDTPIDIIDAELSGRTITTWFADRTLDEVLRIVCAIVDAECVYADGMVRIRSALPG